MRYRGGHSLDTEDELEQYSTRSSVRLTGLPEKPDENNYATVMEVFNDATGGGDSHNNCSRHRSHLCTLQANPTQYSADLY